MPLENGEPTSKSSNRALISQYLADHATEHLQVGWGIIRQRGPALPVGSKAHARHMICQIGDSPSDEMAVQCAIGIASSEQWRQLLSDLINYARPSTRTIQIFARVLQARAPDHPCAGLVDRGVLDAMTIFDAIFIDGIIVAANRFQSDVPTDAALFVLGTETPVESFWRCTTLSWNNVEIGFQAADLTGITESPRSLIKPAILIACTAD